MSLNKSYGIALGWPMGAGQSVATLGTLILSGSLQIGVATSGTIIGATVGSTIVGNIPGITVNSGARTYSGTPTGSAATISNGLVETLAGATNSPLSSAVTVAAAATAVYNTLAANRVQVPNTTSGIPTPYTSKREHWASPQGDVTDLVFVDLGWSMASGVPASDPNHTIKKYVEYPAGTFHQVLWASAGTVVVPSAGQTVSDVVLSSVTGLPLVIPAGTRFWERTGHVTGSTVTFGAIALPAFPSAIGTTDGNSASDLANSGTINASTTSTNSIGSALIKGTVMAATVRPFVLVGDSICDGQGDVSSTGPMGSSGFLARALSANYPCLKISKGGQTVKDLAGATAPQKAMLNNFIALLSWTSGDAIFEGGVNDVTAGFTAANTLTNMQTVYSMFPAGWRKYQTTITPRTDSSNSWADAAGQTAKVDSNDSIRNSLNASIRAIPAQLTGSIEVADNTMTARDSDIWSGPYPPTLDGVHPNSAKATSMALIVPAAVAIP